MLSEAQLEAEQAVALADSESPAFVPGLFQVTAAMWAGESKIAANFRTGAGLEWGHQHPCLFEGTERFFRSGDLGNRIQSWRPALDGVVAKLERGAKVADVGCGVGAQTVPLVRNSPGASISCVDLSAASLAQAAARLQQTGLPLPSFHPPALRPPPSASCCSPPASSAPGR